MGWNLLAGFPGDKAEWYLAMADFLPKLFHLTPSVFGVTPVILFRFSPLFAKAAEFGITERHIRKGFMNHFPPGLVDLNKIGYDFTFHCPTRTSSEQYLRLFDVTHRWIKAHQSGKPPICFYTVGPGFLYISDSRAGEGKEDFEPRYMYLEGLAEDIVLLADRIQTVNRLKQLLAPLYPAEVAGGEVEAAVEELIEADLLMREGQSILSLPIGSKPRTTEELHALVFHRPGLEPLPAQKSNVPCVDGKGH